MAIKREYIEWEYRVLDHAIEEAKRWAQFWIALESRAVLPDMVADVQMEMSRIFQSCKYLREVLESYGDYRIADAVSMLSNRSPYRDSNMVQREINESRGEHRDYGIGREAEREIAYLRHALPEFRKEVQGHELEKREVCCG